MGSYVHKYLITLYVARPTKDTTSARPYSPACAGFGHDSGREEGIAARLGLVLGEQSTPTVSHCTTNGSGGTTGCPHRQWEAWLVPPASSLPGLHECS